MGRKKNIAIADDEYSLPQEDDDAAAAPPPPEKETRSVTGGSKKKKGGKSQRSTVPDESDDLEKLDTIAEPEEEEPIPMAFSGKKKSSKGKKGTSGFSAFSAFNDLGEDEEDNEPESEPEPEPESKQKSEPKSDEHHNLDEEGDENQDLELDFGRIKKKKKKKGGKVAQGDEDLDKLLIELGEGSPPAIAEPEAEPETQAPPAVVEEFVSKKQDKKKKKKGGGRTVQEEDDLDKLLAELGEGPMVAQTAPPPAVTEEPEADGDETKEKDGESKKAQKKKKKKGGRTAQDEEDLDKILAELGEGPAAPAPVPAASSTNIDEPAEEEKEGEGEAAETAETAAAKKKKKKKEKEKEKKAAAAAASSSVTVEATDEADESKAKGNKKQSKRLREMQEAIAKRKEAEERKKREEEERLRKEEEERMRKEEEERLAEEAKRRKKEKEKEKKLKRMQEGKFLTVKQKEEQRRLEAMRRQFLGQGGEVLGSTTGTAEVKRKPKYETKKQKPKVVEKEVVEEVMEADNDVEESMVDDGSAESQSPVADIEEAKEQIEEVKPTEEEEDDDDWDAKSWDDVDVNLKPANTLAKEEEDGGAAKPEVETTKTVPKEVSKPAVKKVVAPPPKEEGEKPVASKKGAKNGDTKSKTESNLRSPICCILGHVDTGKTKLLDCIRRTNVQEGEAGGITQQIGATYFPTENIRERTKELKADATLKVPGLLVIDTPGHESFSNLRLRGSSLCDIAILVVDIMHGLEPQTIESLNMLKSRGTEFIVALNKVDRLYGWKRSPNAPIIRALKQQSEDVKREFNMRLTQIITEFKEQGLNTQLYYKNKEMGEVFNIVPTSAITGEGIPDLLLLLVQWAQKTMEEKLTYVDEVQCTVLEVKVIEGLGTTVDVVLVNGILHEGDQIIVCGMQGPIITTIRALLTPHPMKELRVKGTYLHHKELKAAQGVKLSAQGLEHAIAGTALYVVKPGDDIEALKDAVMQDMERVMGRIDKSGEGVYVQASTLGSLEALTEFLKSPAVNIPFCDFSIGPVHKKDVMKASVMLERKKEYATILAFDVKVMPDARELAEETGVRIFVADIIYHLFDQFKAYIDNLREEKKKESAEEAVFPCVLKIMPNCVFNKKDPIVLGVDVLEGVLKIGTPICIPSREFIDIGKIASIEINHKQVDVATKGQKVAIKIVSSNSEESQKMFGRHFDMEDELVSHITRRSIDILKANYRDDLSMEEWRLVVKLKLVFKIP
ncbi:eukaryotic translation initiation factor 5B-like protein [Carex littledalei]|uniref:Eukaryotic translation initiation factor 5B n=1 Tax=Carex littledalei TaxID=544730 RepID=A0A833QMA6_9POAL|nr:eukaryotic translation initiation factor 5B-like protein [Carex littledalei]